MRSVCTETLGLRHNPELHVTMWWKERYKLSVYHNPEPGPFDCPGELFALDNDPGEINNLWFDAGMQDIKDQLIHKLSAFLVPQDTQDSGRSDQALAVKVIALLASSRASGRTNLLSSNIFR